MQNQYADSFGFETKKRCGSDAPKVRQSSIRNTRLPQAVNPVPATAELAHQQISRRHAMTARAVATATAGCIIEAMEERRLLSATLTTVDLHANSIVQALGSPIVERRVGPTLSGALTGDQVSRFPGYDPGQINQYYGLDQLGFNGAAADGAGQTIAIVEIGDDPTIADDLALFDQQEGLPPPPSLRVVGEDGSSNLPDATSETTETALDVEWAHAIAPAASLIVVEATTNIQTYSDLSHLFVNAVNTAKSEPGVSAVSISYGVPEGLYHAPDSSFATPAGHQGVSFLVSSGDGGSYPNKSTSRQIVVMSPASSPNVIAVGGTTLQYDTNYNPASEIGWGYTQSNGNYAGSGGGLSTLEAEPSYQKSVAGTLGGRGVPDVAFEGDSATGVLVYDTSMGGWGVVGGTSLSAPCWAGIIAIVNQGRTLQGLPTLNSAGASTSTTLYNLPASDFNDITSGTNGEYDAGTGYDLVTGAEHQSQTNSFPIW